MGGGGGGLRRERRRGGGRGGGLGFGGAVRGGLGPRASAYKAGRVGVPGGHGLVRRFILFEKKYSDAQKNEEKKY